MKKVNLHDVPWEDWSSPGGKFHGSSQQLSLALGAKADAIPGEGGHPFDLERGRLRPGKSGCPLHAHWTQFEFYIITQGHGTVRFGTQQREVRAGDAMMHPPFEAHQLINRGDTDLEYLLIADNPVVDLCSYPDSDKWGFRPRGGVFFRRDVDYYVGEEEGAEQRPPRPAPPPLERALARFVTIADLPEIERRSPKGRYHSFVRDVSLAVGGMRDVGLWGGGHPFDVQQRRVPSGAAVCPLHAHTVQSELFVVLTGSATVRANAEHHAVRAGDVFFQPPGVAHQIINSGSEDLVFYVIADNVPADSCFYPDSGKWMIAPQRKCFRMVETDYFDGEE